MADASQTTAFDVVNAAIDTFDLSDAEVVKTYLTALQDEVRYWRENAAGHLSTAMDYAGRPQDLKGWLWQTTPERTLREQVSLLGNALAGKVFPECVGCAVGIRPGDRVIYYSDEGEAHALCAGASAEEMEAGRIEIPPNSIDVDDMTPEEAAAAREDPHATIYASSPLFTPAQIQSWVEKGRTCLEQLEAANLARMKGGRHG